MRIFLQKIELHNFKTYGGTVKVGPLKEFTAVVGPNGSGKSNLLDALSFVLGEDITKLRVKDASQLIHGAHIGRPIAREAWVSASFSSEDGNVYIFKRVISKNSVKHIFNEQAVSIKVYLRELENIGINMQAKNFLVYQGQVEEVALMNSKERSILIEQISGSIQFKREYDECKKSMVVAADKMHMVFKKQRSCRNDLKEAMLERADVIKFDQLKDEWTQQTLKLQLFKLFHNERCIENLVERIESKKSELGESNEGRTKAEENLKECNKILRKRGRELTRIEMEVQEQEAEIQKKLEPLIKAREEVMYMSSKLEQAQDTLQKAHEADKNHKRTLRDLRKELAAVDKEFQEYQRTVAEESLSQGRNIELEQSQATEYNDLKVKAAKRSASYQQEMETLNREQKADQDQLENKQRKLYDIEAAIKQKEDEKCEEMKRSSRLLQSIESSEADFEALISKQQALHVNSKLYEERIVSVQKELESISHTIGDAKYDTYEKDSKQKRQNAIQALKRHFPGVFDRLVNVCDPIHPKYSIALTKVMGKRLNAVVVDNEETAKRCIEYLKANLMGPEEFLPITYLKVKPLAERLRSIKNPKGCKLLFDAVLYDPKVKNAVLFATKSVVVCETADDAQYVAYETYHDRILDAVSLDGSYFQSNGFISGGKADLVKKAREWDEKDIVQMKARKAELSEELRDVLKKSRCASEVQCVNREANGLNARLEVMKKDYQISLKKISACDEHLEKLRAHHQDLEPELREIEGVIKERDRKLKKLQKKLCSIEDEIFARFCEKINVSNIRQYEESGLRSYEERAKISLEFEGRKNRIQNQIEYEMGVDSNSNINRWMAEVEQRKNSLASSAEAVKLQEEIVAGAKEKLKQHQNILAQKKEEQEVLVKNSDEAQHEVRQMVEKVARVSKQLLKIETECESLKRERHFLLLQCKVENIDIPPPGCLDNLVDGSTVLSTESSSSNTPDSQSLYERVLEIEIDYDSLDDSLKDLQNVTEVKEREMQLISDISKTYKKLEAQRMPNMNDQRSEDKVGNTSVKLKETQAEFKANQAEGKKIKDRFERIKKERFDMFMDCFDFVSNEIDTVFKDLTQSTSATAMVIAEDPEEPYLGGVRYNCIAPGKACKHMEDLSGGEKTLASIAFILTLHKYRKAPCLVLDEVDAALDNTNISKVARHFSSNKSEFQTVAISLNPEFYGHADALIGVTREGAQKPSEIYLFDLEGYSK